MSRTDTIRVGMPLSGLAMTNVIRFSRCPRCAKRISPPSAFLLKHHLESCREGQWR